MFRWANMTVTTLMIVLAVARGEAFGWSNPCCTASMTSLSFDIESQSDFDGKLHVVDVKATGCKCQYSGYPPGGTCNFSATVWLAIDGGGPLLWPDDSEAGLGTKQLACPTTGQHDQTFNEYWVTGLGSGFEWAIGVWVKAYGTCTPEEFDQDIWVYVRYLVP